MLVLTANSPDFECNQRLVCCSKKYWRLLLTYDNTRERQYVG
jgi:hypothetical protein